MSIDIETEDVLITEVLNSFGQWRNHIVIGGGYALIIYKLYLANKIKSNPPVGTRDIDSLIPRKIPSLHINNINQHLTRAGFEHNFKDFENPATESYLKEINGFEIEIEFLTDDSARKNKGANITVAGVVAQALPYLKQSLENKIQFKTSADITGWVVSPHAWIFHKGLTFPKRTDKIKIYKDLYGIWYAGTQLGLISEQAISQLLSHGNDKPKWFKTFKTNLESWIAESTPEDWKLLESQDPYGQLKKQSFIYLVKSIIMIQI